ncbi:MAG: helix-turn-helix domain-containing protein [Candidatus Thermoplasmatota archaeon]
MFENIMLLIPSLIFIIIIIILTYKYYNKILDAQKEYAVAKQLVSNIVLTFRKRINEQNTKVDNILYDIEELQSSIEKRRKQETYFQDNINDIIKSMTSVFTINKKLVDNFIVMNTKIDKLKTTDKILYDTLELFKKEQKELLQKPILKLPSDQRKSFVKLTRTEIQIIQILLSEGAKTAPKIMDEINKTREHTSRLMKKLWQEGYIERDTNSIPFIYRPTKELKKRINIET